MNQSRQMGYNNYNRVKLYCIARIIRGMRAGLLEQKFNTTYEYLANKMFVPEAPKQGSVWTSLNITALPDYLAFIKSQLSKEEQMLLSDYHMQTYLLEIALKPHPHNNFSTCTREILSHIRNHKEFWVKNMGSEQESQKRREIVEEYKKDSTALQDQMSKQELKYGSAPFVLNRQKIITDDYVYVSHPQSKHSYRLSANLFPLLLKYLLSQQIIRDQKQKFCRQVFAYLASRYRPKQKYAYQRPFNNEQKIANEEGERTMESFVDYLSKKEQTDIENVSCSKEYYFSINMLHLIKYMAENKFNEGMDTNELKQKQIKQERTNDAQQISKIELESANRVYSSQQIAILGNHILSPSVKRELTEFQAIRIQQEQASKRNWVGFYETTEEIKAICDRYNSQIIMHPSITSQTRYKVEGADVPWSEIEYKKFLEVFFEFFNIPTNNKRIATGIGKGIEPNHVKHVKGVYMRNMTSRIDNGEIGGGKKGPFDSKLDFLKRDIENFSMRWFKRDNRSKTKRIKRRKKKPNFDGEEHDSDY